eukprot:44365_1
MEFSDVGCYCHFNLCRQYTFLPLQCAGCNYEFCKKHIDKTDHQCTQRAELTSKQIKSTKNNISYKCSYNGCKKKELIDIKCKQCKLTFCLSHRFSDCHDCTGPIPEEKKHKKQHKNKNKNTVIQNNAHSTPLLNNNIPINNNNNNNIALIAANGAANAGGNAAKCTRHNVIGHVRDRNKKRSIHTMIKNDILPQPKPKRQRLQSWQNSAIA